MEAGLSQYFDFYEFTTGRRLFALRAIVALAESLGEQEIADSAREAVEFNEEVRETEQQWARERNVDQSVRVAADKLDDVVDRTVGGFHTRLKSDVQTFPADTPLGKKARELKRKAFPEGAAAVINQAFEDELSTLEQMNKLLAKMRASHVEPLGHGAVVDRIADLTVEYAEALEAPKTRKLDFKNVRAMRLQGQEHMLRVAAKIVGQFNGESPGDAETRQKLMLPIVEQNERIGDYYRRRRQVPDIDPDTGEDVPTD